MGVHVTPDLGTVSLQELPLYSCPTDGVIITASACTPPTAGGRIFLGASDGALHELCYSGESTWRSRRCTKACYAPLSRSLLPRPLRPWVLGTPPAVRQVLADPFRGLVYTRSGDGTLSVYDVGVTCMPHDGGARLVDSVKAFEPLLRRDGFLRGSSGGGGGGSSGRGPRGAAVTPIGIAVISPEEGGEATLVVALSDGRRIYLSVYPRGVVTTHPVGSAMHMASPAGVLGSMPSPPPLVVRPTAFRAVAVARDAPPHNSAARAPGPAAGGTPGAAAAAAAAAPGGGASRPPPGIPFAGFEVGPPLRADAAFYSDGLLLLNETEAGAASSTLLCAAADSAGVGPQLGPLRELVTSLPLPGVLAGDASGLAELPLPLAAAQLLPAPPYAVPRGAELATQHVAGPRTLVVLSSAGVSLLTKARPIDTLDALLSSGVRHHVEAFFTAFGQGEAAAMCVWLALQHQDAVVRAAARRCLDDTRLCGEARMSGDDAPQQNQVVVPSAAATQLMNMGTSLVAHQPVFSAAYTGCCLAARRLLKPCWRRLLVAPLTQTAPPPIGTATATAAGAPDAGVPLQLCMSPAALAGLESRCRALAGLVAERAGRTAAGRGVASTAGGAATMLSPPWTAGGGATSQQAAATHEAMAKRRRLEDAAAAERSAHEALAQTLVRSADALALLRLAACPPHMTTGGAPVSTSAAARYFPAASARVPVNTAVREVLRTRATLRLIATSTEGEAVCAALIEAMREQARSEGGDAAARSLADALSAQCGSFFAADRATLFDARNALDAALAAAPGTPGRSAGVQHAMALLLTIPGAVPVVQYGEELARVQAWPQLVDLCIGVARSAADDVTSVGNSGASVAAHPRVVQASKVVGDAVTALAWPTQAAGMAAPPPAPPSGVGSASVYELHTPEARMAALHSLLDAAGAALARRLQGAAFGGDGDASVALPPGEAATSCVASALFSALVDASDARTAAGHTDCTALIMGLPSGCSIDAWLVQHGRMDDAIRRAPLTRRQARLLVLAAERAAASKRFGHAARVMRALGLRAPPPPGEPPLSLTERKGVLIRAVMWAEVAPAHQLPPDEAADIAATRAVLAFQERLAAAAASADGMPDLGEAQVQAQVQATGMGGGGRAYPQLAPLTLQLLREPLPLSTLFNDVALDPRLQCLDVAIEMFAFSGVGDSPDQGVAKPLWDGLLTKALASAAGAAAQLAAACDAVAQTGAAAYPSEAALPLAHLALRLEQIAQGKWPPPSGPPTPPSGASAHGSDAITPVAAALLAACRGAAEPALGCVQDVLTTSGGEVADPHIRLALLHTLLDLTTVAAEPLRGGWAMSVGAPSYGVPYGRSGVRSGAALRARLAEVCDVSAAEVRRLQVPGTPAIAARFEALQRELVSL